MQRYMSSWSLRHVALHEEMSRQLVDARRERCCMCNGSANETLMERVMKLLLKQEHPISNKG